MTGKAVLRRAKAYLITAGAAAALLLSPSLGTASSGGAAIAPSGGNQAHPGNRTVSATAHGVTIITRASGFLSKNMRFFGTVSRHYAGQAIDIERAGDLDIARLVAAKVVVHQADRAALRFGRGVAVILDALEE